MNDSRFDLNLLLALEVLLAERSVTRAARRIGLSQPAMSGALARLRALVGDPLFIRTAAGMLPTPRALELGATLGPALAAIRSALEEAPAFDPASSSRRFVLAAHEQASPVILPSLVPELTRLAPGVGLRVLPLHDHRAPAGLAEGNIDLALGVFSDLATGHRRRVLFHEELVSVVRADHPDVGGDLDLARYLELSHVFISPKGSARGPVDQALERQGASRSIRLSVPSLLDAAVALTTSDLVLTVGRRVVTPLAARLGLRVVRPPLELPPHEFALVWHERAHRDPAHAWLRKLLYDLVLDETELPPRDEKAVPSRRERRDTRPARPSRRRTAIGDGNAIDS